MHGHMHGDADHHDDHEDDRVDANIDDHKISQATTKSPFIFPGDPDYSLDDVYMIDDYAPLEIQARDDDDLSIKFQSVEYDSSWTPNVQLGEVAGVDTDDDGTLWVFHRGDRTWNAHTFQYNSDIIQDQGNKSTLIESSFKCFLRHFILLPVLIFEFLIILILLLIYCSAIY